MCKAPAFFAETEAWSTKGSGWGKMSLQFQSLSLDIFPQYIIIKGVSYVRRKQDVQDIEG